jgi:hypothetical protein
MRDKGDPMKKLPKKLTLAKETLLHLEAKSLGNVVGALSADVTNCKSGCTYCVNTACAFC